MPKTLITLSTMALMLGYSAAADARACRRLTKTEGAVVGAVAGGILGNVVAGHGHHTTGTVVGAVAGGVAGHEIARTRYRRCRDRR
jgi:osmotically inducible lipoprotein OsmB